MTLSSIHPHRLVALLPALAVLLWVSPAQAGYNAWCTEAYEDSPADGSVDVPLNPMLLYPSVFDDDYYSNPSLLVLVDEHGNTEDLVDDDLRDGECFRAFFPTRDLEPNTTYEVLYDEELLASFTTGGDIDDEPPAFVAGEDDPDRGLFFEYESDEPVVLVSMVSSVGIDHEFIGITPGETTVDFTDWTRNREPGSSVTLVIFDISGNSVTVSAKMAGTSSSQDDGLEDDASEDDASEDGASGDEPAAGTCAIASAGAMPWPSVLVSMLVLLAGLGARRR